ncbi:MAG: hypothetical protein H6R01_230 [Burkholderiaceae bacterium]|nr:hypothetical protein [Burkholderiaceae bacterium]
MTGQAIFKRWRRLALLLPTLLLAACAALEPQQTGASAEAKNEAGVAVANNAVPAATTAPTVSTASGNVTHDKLRAIATMQERLDHVAGPLLLKNAIICKKQARNLLGFTAKNRYSYSEAMADSARDALGLGEPLQVMSVMAGSGAERVGLRKGDNLIAVANKPMPQGRNAEYDAPAVLAPFVVGQNSVKLTVQRDGKNQTLSVPLTPACAFRIELGNTDSVDMYADGRRVLVTRGMMNFVRSDEELAYVIAKGMVHNLLGHPQKMQTVKTTADIINNLMQVQPDAGKVTALKPVPQAMDTLADRLSMVVVARAGLRVDGAPAFWQRLAAQHPASEAPDSFTARHPAMAQRIAAMEKAISQINSVRVSRKLVKKVQAKPAAQSDEQAEEAASDSSDGQATETAAESGAEHAAVVAGVAHGAVAEQATARKGKRAKSSSRKADKKSVKKAAGKKAVSKKSKKVDKGGKPAKKGRKSKK